MSQACRRFCSIHSGSSVWRDSSSTALLESPLGRALGIDGHPILFVRGPEPLVTLVFEFESQFFATRLDNSVIEHDMHEVRGVIVQDALVVGDEQNTQFRSSHRIDDFRYNFERIYIRAGIRFMHHYTFPLYHR